MNMFDKAFKKTEKGQFTERIFGMDNRQFIIQRNYINRQKVGHILIYENYEDNPDEALLLCCFNFSD